jgi:alpha-1,2-mannosyltransferase
MMQYILYTALLITRLHASIYAIIPDCDEVYNYWEPLNFLTRFFGKQTWEYSPEYAIRSWVYLIPYSLLIYPINWFKYLINFTSLVNINIPTYTLFYLVRIILALSFTISEIKLSKSLKFLNKNIPNWFLFSQILSPGMYQASISILPSSFTLLFGILSTHFIIHFFNTEKFISSIDTELVNLESSIKDENDESQADNVAPRTNMLLNLHRVSIPLITKSYTMATLLISIGGLAGWPFSLILIIPFITYVLIKSLIYTPKSVLRNNYSTLKTFTTYLLAGFASLFFIAYFISQFDSLFYKKVTYVSYNILSYNVFNASKLIGPEIFGIESYDWYFKNLLLNFHIFFIIATLNFLTFFNTYQLIIYKLPLLIWFAIFISQPHKEERFIYPVYHLISISFAQFMSCETFKSNFLTKFIKKLLNWFVILSTIILFLTRVNNLNTNYSAPINVFRYLSDNSNSFTNIQENVCIGREWYHYPSSLFLHDNQRLKFTKSSFDGMLPGDFNEPKIHNFEGLVNTTSTIPKGFNNENRFNSNFIVNSDDCRYLIDINKETSKFDETSILDTSKWEILYCEDVLDIDNSTGIDKILNFTDFFNKFIINPWLNLQKDLSVIELNRKFMEMYGLKDPKGTEMFDGLYIKLNSIKDFINDNFGNYLGHVEVNKFCVARRK